MNKDAIIERQANENLKLIIDNQDLQQRIDKAIEYIEDNLGKDDNGCGAWWYAFQDYQEAKDELLSILRGEE